MKTIQFYNDPGHGWAKVPLRSIKALGIQNDISHYSYMSKDHAYLEEDCDAIKAINAISARCGVIPKVIENHANKSSRIRNYCRYNPVNVDWNTCRVKGQ
jgi:hypothetical protein